MLMFFFFQAEDGIRDLYVTGVQTCALPISRRNRSAAAPRRRPPSPGPSAFLPRRARRGTTAFPSSWDCPAYKPSYPARTRDRVRQSETGSSHQPPCLGGGAICGNESSKLGTAFAKFPANSVISVL